ncbi:MAG: metallophosphoesterase [Deltaproteobacteria bacterium]|nr:metallophosphoesterase [Deltaproteobacteria bacterium]
MVARRDFLKMGALALAISGGACASLSKVDTSTLETTKLELPIKGLPLEFDRYRIGFISDIHLGPFVANSLLEATVDLVNQHHADLLLLGGDFINLPMILENLNFWYVRNNDFSDPTDRTLIYRIYDTLGRILSQAQCPDGIYSVYGNHDRWFAPRTCAERFKHHRIGLLVNHTVNIKRNRKELQIIGVDDYWSGNPSLPQNMAPKTSRQTRILLAHNPDYISKVLTGTNFEFDLGLAGHTHGGQICMPFIGSLLHNVQDRRFSAGLFQHEKAAVYTTRGIGVVEIPLRLNCPPEVCLFTLRVA